MTFFIKNVLFYKDERIFFLVRCAKHCVKNKKRKKMCTLREKLKEKK